MDVYFARVVRIHNVKELHGRNKTRLDLRRGQRCRQPSKNCNALSPHPLDLRIIHYNAKRLFARCLPVNPRIAAYISKNKRKMHNSSGRYIYRSVRKARLLSQGGRGACMHDDPASEMGIVHRKCALSLSPLLRPACRNAQAVFHLQQLASLHAFTRPIWGLEGFTDCSVPHR